MSKLWGVAVGQPTADNPSRNNPNVIAKIGTFISDPYTIGIRGRGPNGEMLYSSYGAALAEARRLMSINRWWTYVPKRFRGEQPSETPVQG